MVTSYSKGYGITWVTTSDAEGGYWVWSDNEEPIKDNPRPCKKCRIMIADGEADPCLGVLPGVVNACCGHGVREQAYVMFENGQVVRGFKTIQRK